ncbi:hypothetical protein G9A89_010038 [Geosiphon pyriformis]|nr:hypothetical protein G9A89_010038 [Geosiphon pyriformis]
MEIELVKYIHIHNDTRSHEIKKIKRSSNLYDGEKKRLLQADVKRNHFDEYAWWAMRSYCLNKVENMVGAGIYAAVEIRDSKLILMVRGDSSVGNEQYWSNRNNELVNYITTNQNAVGAKVDKVFYENFKKTKGAMKKLIFSKMENRNVNEIVAVGHGSGGIYAVLQMLEMTHLNILRAVYTFGQPYLGNFEFVQYIATLDMFQEVFIERITNIDDYVPKLPLNTFHSFYKHTSLEIWIGSDCECSEDDAFMCTGPIISHENIYVESESQVGSL